MYQNIICFFSFLFMTRNVRNGRVGERVEDGGDVHTRWDANLQWNASSSFCFRKIGTGPPQSSESSFYTLLCFHDSRQLTLFSISQPWVIWRKANAQSGVTVSSSFTRLFRGFCLLFFFFFWLLGFQSSLIYIISRIPTQSLWSHLLTRCTWTCILSTTQLTRHFHWGNSWVMLTLGNRSSCCCANHPIYATCQKRSSSQYSTFLLIQI